MDRLREMELFVAVVEAGGLASGGRSFGMSAPAVSRGIASLEERLGVRLLHRTTRRIGLTDAGARYLESIRRLLEDLRAAERDAAGEAGAPRGHLTVTASVTFGRTALAPVLRSFLAAYPDVTLSVPLLDRVVNLVEEGIDVAVRIGDLSDSSMVARRVGEIRRILVASPAYLAQRGVPQRPADLRDHAVVAFTGLMPHREWRHIVNGASRAVSVMPRLEINDALTCIDAARHDEGITIALSYMVAGELRAGTLVPVLEEFAPPAAPIHLVHPAARLVAPKLRAFLDHAGPELQRCLRGI